MNDSDSINPGLAAAGLLSVLAMSVFCDRIVTPDEISRAEKVCENANSDLAWFETNFFEIEVTCKNAARFVIGTDNSVQFDATVEAEPTQTEVNQNE